MGSVCNSDILHRSSVNLDSIRSTPLANKSADVVNSTSSKSCLDSKTFSEKNSTNSEEKCETASNDKMPTADVKMLKHVAKQEHNSDNTCATEGAVMNMPYNRAKSSQQRSQSRTRESNSMGTCIKHVS